MRIEIVKMRMFFVKMLMNCEIVNTTECQEGRWVGQKQRPTFAIRTAKDASLFCRRSRVTQEKDSQIHKKDSQIVKSVFRKDDLSYLHIMKII